MKAHQLALAVIAAFPLASSPALAAHKPTPKISLQAARAKALELAPGKVMSAEYEREDGIWRYSFDIQQKGHVQEIGIDAMTGKVVENTNEGASDND